MGSTIGKWLLQLMILIYGGAMLVGLLSAPHFQLLHLFDLCELLLIMAALFSLTRIVGCAPDHRALHVYNAVLLLGLFFVFTGVGTLLGAHPLPSNRANCVSAACSLINLLGSLFGATSGKFITAFLYGGIGAFLCFVGITLRRT